MMPLGYLPIAFSTFNCCLEQTNYCLLVHKTIVTIASTDVDAMVTIMFMAL